MTKLGADDDVTASRMVLGERGGCANCKRCCDCCGSRGGGDTTSASLNAVASTVGVSGSNTGISGADTDPISETSLGETAAKRGDAAVGGKASIGF